MTRPLTLGRARAAKINADAVPYELPPHHLVTHGICVGMTGSGKTGLAIGLIEEAIRSKIPVLMIDIKGDLPNLALLMDRLAADEFLPWVDADAAKREGKKREDIATELARKWSDGLAGWSLAAADVKSLRESMRLRIITPGTTSAGESLNVLSPLEGQGTLWDSDEEAARDALSGALSLLLRMVKRDADQARSKEHVLLAHLAERRQRQGQPGALTQLVADLLEPPISTIGALSVDEFYPAKERADLAQDLNALIASPTFASWQKGAPLDVASWMRTPDDDPRVAATILSVAHLEDEERLLVLGLVLEQTLAYVRGLSGTTDLRALILFDEVFGFLPPHPANPPTKRPLLALLKQARAFGVGCVLATQNPVDLDYKAISNAGVWFIGRLQTDTDRERVVEGLAGSDAGSADPMERSELESLIKDLPPRTFLVRNVNARGEAAKLLETRWTLSWLRGPMTRAEIRKIAQTNTPSQSAPARNTPIASAPIAGSSSGPKLPINWRSLFPFPPEAPVAQWKYVTHVGIIAEADLTDRKNGFSIERRIALLCPLEAGSPNFARITEFDRTVFEHEAVAGASFGGLGALAEKGQVKAIEKGLKERAIDALSIDLFVHTSLRIVSTPGETQAAFIARCTQLLAAACADEKAKVSAKHDPKIQKLAQLAEMSKGVGASVDVGTMATAAFDILTGRVGGAISAGGRAMRKVSSTQAKQERAQLQLQEAVQKRNAELAAIDAEYVNAGSNIVSQKLKPAAANVRIETYAVVWMAS